MINVRAPVQTILSHADYQRPISFYVFVHECNAIPQLTDKLSALSLSVVRNMNGVVFIVVLRVDVVRLDLISQAR